MSEKVVEKTQEPKILSFWNFDEHKCQTEKCCGTFSFVTKGVKWDEEHIPRDMTVQQFCEIYKTKYLPRIPAETKISEDVKAWILICDSNYKDIHHHYEAPFFVNVFDLIWILRSSTLSYHIGLGITPSQIDLQYNALVSERMIHVTDEKRTVSDNTTSIQPRSVRSENKLFT